MKADTFYNPTPGLYLRGREPEPHPPTLSAVTGFVGVTAEGPPNQPRAIRNWGEFVDEFGGFISYGYLPRAVFGFFLNGGEMCYVVRVAREGGENGFINAEGILYDANGNPRVQVVSKVKGSAGNNIRVGAPGFTTAAALKAPQTREDGKHFITVHNINAFIGDRGRFKIASGAAAERIKIDIDGVDTAANKLVLQDPMKYVYPVGAVLSNRRRFNITVMTDESPEPLEVFYNLSMNPDNKRFFEKVIGDSSEYISVVRVAGGGLSMPPVGETQLAGGKDPGQIDYRYYTGYEDDGTYFEPTDAKELLGLAALENIPDISLAAVPDLERMDHNSLEDEDVKRDFAAAQKHILYHCRKMGERFAILDPMKGVGDLPDFPAKEAKFGVLYYPWLYCTIEGKKQPVPPSGFVAGVMARTDREYGINKAPANEKIKGVVDLEAAVDRTVQEELNTAGINCIRKFEDGDIKIWGSRTLSMETQWRYVNVRRIFLNIIKTLSKELLWVVFEPNGPNLWKQVEAAITAFLNARAADGMTAGANEGEAFYVRCNEETNPKEVVEAGQVLAEVGVALSAPAEFIVITVKRTPESLSIIEEDI